MVVALINQALGAFEQVRDFAYANAQAETMGQPFYITRQTPPPVPRQVAMPAPVTDFIAIQAYVERELSALGLNQSSRVPSAAYRQLVLHHALELAGLLP